VIQDILIDIFERIENFFERLEVYIKVPPTLVMTNMMAKIMVEVLDILGTATKEMKQSRASVSIVVPSSSVARGSCMFRKVSEEGGGNNEARG
jgi:transposase